MQQPRRLSSLDRVFLDLDTAETPQQVGWVIRFDGRCPSLDELRGHLSSRLAQLPLFTMRISRPKRRFGSPRWSAAGDFSIADHVLAARATADPDALSQLAGRLLSQRLEPALPLWRLWLVDGLADGWAIVGHAHHALVDGVAAVEVATLLLDSLSAPIDTRGEVTAPAARKRVSDPRRPRRQKDRLRRLMRGVRMMVLRGPRTALDSAGCGTRSIGLGASELSAVKDRARGYGATTNDALLAATSRALTAELRSRGELAPWIKVLMPFRLSHDPHGRSAGNEISAVTVKLPLGELATEDLFTSITSGTQDAKALGNAGVMAIVARCAGFIPAPLRPRITRWVYRRLHFNVIVSNLRGPLTDLGLLGRRATAIYPVVPLTQGQGLSIGAMTYRGRVWLGVNVNGELLDATAFTRRIEDGFNAS